MIAWTCTALVVALLAAARRRDAARREAVARATHELRGPLQAAVLALHGAGPSPRVAAAGQELRRAALVLADLEAAREPVRVVRPAPVDVGALVARHLPAWRALAARHGSTLRVQLPAGAAIVTGEPLRLAQAIANLVANAAEHGGGEIELRVRGGERVAVEVIDDGPGLPAPVARLAAGRRGGRGARGRGLAIATAIAGAHGGRLAAAPAARGARLVLDLPRPERRARA